MDVFPPPRAKQKQTCQQFTFYEEIPLSLLRTVRQSESRYVPQKQGNIPDVYGTHLCVKMSKRQ